MHKWTAYPKVIQVNHFSVFCIKDKNETYTVRHYKRLSIVSTELLSIVSAELLSIVSTELLSIVSTELLSIVNSFCLER